MQTYSYKTIIIFSYIKRIIFTNSDLEVSFIVILAGYLKLYIIKRAFDIRRKSNKLRSSKGLILPNKRNEALLETIIYII